MDACPFKIGDLVVYQPTLHGRGHLVMTDLANLEPGRRYTIAKIDQNAYVVIEGFENSPGGGVYWTEFSGVADVG